MTTPNYISYIVLTYCTIAYIEQNQNVFTQQFLLKSFRNLGTFSTTDHNPVSVRLQLPAYRLRQALQEENVVV